MVRDITYCSNEDCVYEDCWRHMAQLKNEKQDVIISIANFGGVCRKYIGSLVNELALKGLEDRLDDTLYITDEVPE